MILAAADPIVDWGALGEALYLSVGFGLAVLVVAAVAVASSLRAADGRDDRRGGAVAINGFVTIVCVAGLIAAVAAGIYLMTQK